MSINYFSRTAAKDWDIAEAIICYNQEESAVETSLYELLLRIKNDLQITGKTQTSLNRYVLKALVQVDKLLQLRCLGVGRGTQEIQDEGPAAITVNNISRDEEVNIAGVNNVTLNPPNNKRRATYKIVNQVATDVGEGSSMYSINPPSMPVQRPHKTKLRKVQTEALNQSVYFGTSFSQSNPTFQ